MAITRQQIRAPKRLYARPQNPLVELDVTGRPITKSNVSVVDLPDRGKVSVIDPKRTGSARVIGTEAPVRGDVYYGPQERPTTPTAPTTPTTPTTPVTPTTRRTETGDILVRKDDSLAGKISALDKLDNQQQFLKFAEDIIKRKQAISQPLSAQKAYWRGIQRETTPFGGKRDPGLEYPGMFTDEEFRQMSPAEQASVRAARSAAAGAHLEGIREEEEYRGTRVEDVLSSISDVLEEKRKAKGAELDEKIKKLTIREKLADLGGDYEFTDAGNIERTYTGATADNLANAIKAVESGGDYGARGGSGESGAYQFMPATWRAWSSDYAKSVLKQSAQELEMTEQNQDAVAKWKIQQWLDKGLSPKQVAAKWNSGSEYGWEKKVGINKQGVRYDVPAYVGKVTGVLDRLVPEAQEFEGLELTPAVKTSLMQTAGLTNADVKGYTPDDWILLKDATREVAYDDATDLAKELSNKDEKPEKIFASLQRQFGKKLTTADLTGVMTNAGYKKDSIMGWTTL